MYVAHHFVLRSELFNKVVIGKSEEDATRRYFQQLITSKDKDEDKRVVQDRRLKRRSKRYMETDAKIFEITPFSHLVKVKKSDGDTLEYRKANCCCNHHRLRSIMSHNKHKLLRPRVDDHKEDDVSYTKEDDVENAGLVDCSIITPSHHY
ncbi:hypothetical protein GQ457_01G034550 [Hibiscus cannabinus]